MPRWRPASGGRRDPGRAPLVAGAAGRSPWSCSWSCSTPPATSGRCRSPRPTRSCTCWCSSCRRPWPCSPGSAPGSSWPSSWGRPCSARSCRWQLLPHRSGDLVDVVADLTGVALGVLVGLSLRGVLARGPRPVRRPEPGVTTSGRGRGDAAPLVDLVVHRGARTHGRVRRDRRVRPRPIPPGAPVTPSSNRPPRTTVLLSHRFRGSSCFAAFAIGSKTCLSTSDR